MRYAAILTFLLALQVCAPEAQNSQKSKDAGKAAAAERAAPRRVVCIDPGHPSEVSSGRVEQNGTNETLVAWSVALKLQKALEERGYEVVLTKSAEGELVRNKDRALVANRADADLMVRLHCDASIESGYAIYYPDREGRARDGTRGPAPHVIEASRRAAESIHAGMRAGLGDALNDNGVRTDYQTKVGRDQGGALTGSIFSDVPVVTIEMVVLSDPDDAAFIKAEEGQQRMASSIADGITRFFKDDSPQAHPRRKR
ncbi:MAG TPA: N-acetylmuramoyl-L-alanine amidase [Pyrinomonadaceae bacterium]|nr:N-acetylmuramoyl-L-alanine amidase [Pyrinomonadaceae bacterium]